MTRLLGADEPDAVQTFGAPGDSPFLIVCDHAGRLLPRSLGALGLSPSDLERHIAWDIGAAEVARSLAAILDNFAILQTYSRLVIDCNRPPDVASSIPTLSEDTVIPGNLGIAPGDRAQRIAEIFRPYHERIATELARRLGAALPTALIAIHSFTPVYLGEPRPWHAGLLYNRDDRLARTMIGALAEEGAFLIGDNQPYAVSDLSDYTIPVHAERRSLPYAEIEIRQDLLADGTARTRWAERIAQALRMAWAGLTA